MQKIASIASPKKRVVEQTFLEFFQDDGQTGNYRLVGLVSTNALLVSDGLVNTSRLPVAYPHVPIWITSGWPTICPEPWSSFPRRPLLESFRFGELPSE
jgi:hypothetical protein